AEQSATAAAAGLAREAKLPVLGTYATFAAARNLDQLRTSVCYGNFNVLLAGAHGGVSVGPDGATHQALEDLFAVCGLPNMVPEAMRAAYILKKDFGYEARVLNMHTLKPLDRWAVVRAARETGIVVTAEEHQVGALAWRVSAAITEAPELYDVPVITGAIGIQ